MEGLGRNTTLSHYRIDSKIGAGGMGEVYLAQDTKLDRKVALKILPADVAANRDRMERFVREAKSAAALNHPNIAHVYEIDESAGTHFIAMEYIDGDTLREKIHYDKSPLPKLLKYLIQVAEGLSKAHAAGIVHRDLKPDNIMITRDEYVKILDFGLAKLVEPQGFASGARGSSEIATAIMQSHSTPGIVMGTIGYMSPEQASGRVHEIDHRSDIFSFGCILFEAATGQRAFEGKDALDSLHKIVHAPTPQLKDTNPLAPDELQRIVRRCLAKEPEKRYQSIKEVAIELDDLQQEMKGQTASDYSRQATSSASATTSGAARSDEGFWVAVLPFKASGTSSEVTALAEGLSEDIIAGLSRFSCLRVIARSSTLRFTGNTSDVRSIGKELGARYVMEGSLRQVGSTLRLVVQLIDAATGTHLWAETYDRQIRAEEIFALQDELVPRIVSTVADWYGVLTHSMSEAVRLKPLDQLTPYEALLRSFGYYERVTAEEQAASRSALQRAVEQAPGNADAWAMLSMIYGEEHRFDYNVLPDPLGRSLQAARRAVSIAPSNHSAHLALAQALFFRKEFDAFRSAAERAISLNPMDGSTLEYLAHLICFSGDWDYGSELAERARNLNPNHPGWYWAVPFYDAFRKGDYIGARVFAPKIDMPNDLCFAMVAAVYGQLGEREPAEKAVRELLVLRPEFARIGRVKLEKWYLPELVEPLIDGLRKAGLEIADRDEVSSDSLTEARSETPFQATEALQKPSIAVLPFANISKDPDNEYFCDGLAEELLNALAKIEDLKVAARTSAFSFKNRNVEASEIGRALNVKTILEGSVRKSGNHLRITVQLINVGDGYHLWSERYDRQMQDVFDVQDEITLAVVDALKVKLLVEEKAAILKRGTDNTEAYELYLRGLFYWNKRTRDNIRRAIDLFQQAIERDPNYALGYVGLADCYVVLEEHSGVPASETLPKARAAAKRALQIDDSLAEAHTSLAYTYQNLWRWAEAEEEYRRAVRLNPNYPTAHHWFATYFTAQRKFDDAMREIKQAQELDPLSQVINYNVAQQYLLKNDPDSAIEQCQKIIELHPNYPGAHKYLGFAYLKQRHYEEATAEFQKAVELTERASVNLRELGYCYAVTGRRQDALVILKELEEKYARCEAIGQYPAGVYAGLGDKNEAFAWLEKDFQQHSGLLPDITWEFTLEDLRSDPRYQDLLRRMDMLTDETAQDKITSEARTAIPSSANIDLKETSVRVAKTDERPSQRDKLKTKRRWWLIALLSFVLLTAGIFAYRYFTPNSKQIESIAVMPFVNASGNADVEYLSDGMTETLISSLSQLPNLNVKARSTVFRYKGKETDAKTIGKELNVQAILNGRVVQRGDQITLSLELVDVSTENAIWSQQYNRKQTDLISLQSEIARDVSSNLKTKLSGTDEAKVTKSYTTNPEAYQLYLKGNFYRMKYTEEGYRKGIEYYQKAIAIDPNYALAYQGIAAAYDFAAGDYLSMNDALPQTKTASLKALELDDTIAEAHYQLGRIAFWYEWNWAAAEKHWRRANELDPTYPANHPWYLAAIGRVDEAIRAQEVLLKREPLDLWANVDLAGILLAAGQFDQSIEQTRKALELDPNFWWSYQLLGLAYERKKQYAEAIAAMEKARRLDINPAILGYLGYVYAAAGKTAEARKVLEELKELSKDRYVAPFNFAHIYAGLNEKDQAFDWLERAYQDRSYRMATLRVENWGLDNLRSDPRYRELLKRMNLPE